MALTDSERQKVLFHLGYPATEGGVLVGGGTSFPTQLSHVAIYQMDRLTADGETRVRMILTTMDGIEAKMVKAQSRLSVVKVETIAIRSDETDALEAEYQRWKGRLADTIGCYIANSNTEAGTGGINVPRTIG